MKNVKLLALFLFVLLHGWQLMAQVGINTLLPDTGVILDIKSSNKGILLPRLKEDELYKTPPPGALYYNSTEQKFKYKDSLNGIRRVNPLNEDALGNLTAPHQLTVQEKLNVQDIGSASGTVTANGNFKVTGIITGNGSGVTSVNADLLDGQHGAYYSSDQRVTDLKAVVTGLSATKLDASVFTDDWVYLNAGGSYTYVTIGGWLKYKVVGDLVFVRGKLEFTPLVDILSEFAFSLGTPYPVEATYLPVSTYNLKDGSGFEGESYGFLYCFLSGSALDVKAPNTWQYRKGIKYYVPLNFFYEK